MTMLDEVMETISLKKAVEATERTEVEILLQKHQMALVINKKLATSPAILNANEATLGKVHTLLKVKHDCLIQEERLQQMLKNREATAYSEAPVEPILQGGQLEQNSVLKFIDVLEHYQKSCPRDENGNFVHTCKNCAVEQESDCDGDRYLRTKCATPSFARGSVELHLPGFTYYYDIANDDVIISSCKKDESVKTIVEETQTHYETDSVVSEVETVVTDLDMYENTFERMTPQNAIDRILSQMTITSTVSITSTRTNKSTTETAIGQSLPTISETSLISNLSTISGMETVFSDICTSIPKDMFTGFNDENICSNASDLLQELISGSLKTERCILMFKDIMNKIMDQQQLREQLFRERTTTLLNTCCSEDYNRQRPSTNQVKYSPYKGSGFCKPKEGLRPQGSQTQKEFQQYHDANRPSYIPQLNSMNCSVRKVPECRPQIHQHHDTRCPLYVSQHKSINPNLQKIPNQSNEFNTEREYYQKCMTPNTSFERGKRDCAKGGLCNRKCCASHHHNRPVSSPTQHTMPVCSSAKQNIADTTHNSSFERRKRDVRKEGLHNPRRVSHHHNRPAPTPAQQTMPEWSTAKQDIADCWRRALWPKST